MLKPSKILNLAKWLDGFYLPKDSEADQQDYEIIIRPKETAFKIFDKPINGDVKINF